MPHASPPTQADPQVVDYGLAYRILQVKFIRSVARDVAQRLGPSWQGGWQLGPDGLRGTLEGPGHPAHARTHIYMEILNGASSKVRVTSEAFQTFEVAAGVSASTAIWIHRRLEATL